MRHTQGGCPAGAAVIASSRNRSDAGSVTGIVTGQRLYQVGDTMPDELHPSLLHPLPGRTAGVSASLRAGRDRIQR